MKPYFTIVLVALSWGCAGKNSLLSGTVDSHYTKGEAYFAEEKWVSAAEQFNWIVLNRPASDRAAEAQYYYAESVYQQDLFVEAQLEFERYLRRWTATDRAVQVRYRIVECLVAQSPHYFHDQSSTENALVELQAFIDEFHASPQREEAEALIVELRSKIAQKQYESGRQYLKWQRGSSAKLYFENVLSSYYDTPFADMSRLGIIVSHIVSEDVDAAEAYFDAEKDNFLDAEFVDQAIKFIESARNDTFDLEFFINLYR